MHYFCAGKAENLKQSKQNKQKQNMTFLKTTLLTLLSFSIAGGLNAQTLSKKEKKAHFTNVNTNSNLRANDYTFSLSSGTYVGLTGTTSVTNNQLWDDPVFIVPIGFNFQLYNKTITDVYFGAGYGGSLSDTIDANFAPNYILAPFETDLIDRGDISGVPQSPISYKVDGTVGSRIFKLEFKNAGFSDESDSLNTLNDYINFQMWLYEGANNIEYRFGPNMLVNPSINYFGETGAIIGVLDYSVTNAYLLSGPASGPSLTGNFDFINGTPTDGLIYQFFKTPNGITDTEKNTASISFYPNPFNSSTKIKISGHKLNQATIKITDVLGKTVKVLNNIETNEIYLEKENLSNGIYFYQLIENNTVLTTGKFVVE